jgi:hypothetical protein
MKTLSPFFVEYVAAWSSFCVLSACLVLKDRARLLAEWHEYLKFLCVPWKLCLFVPAFSFVTIAGRYTNDETWDLVTGSGMSLLTFLTAPWAIGVFYQAALGRRPLRDVLVASALLLFSSSWFYDAYLLWRDGSYTQRWAGNLMLSPFIYLAAGLLWNLEANDDCTFGTARFRFSFVRPDWPSRPIDSRFEPLILASIPLILIAAFVLVAFVRWNVSIP